MEKMIAFCGLICSECPAFLATRNDDDAQRKKTAEMWSVQYGMGLKPEDINCDGCLSNTGRLINHCNVCEIRKCGQDKGLENCAHCGEYACEKLDNFFKVAPNSKTTLDEIKQGL
jgi:hypothetical protein